MTKPITPDEVVQLKRELIPDQVIDTFNRLIVENWDGYSSTVKQEKVISEIYELYPTELYDEEGHYPDRGTAKERIFQKGWLDVEDIFSEAGWKVKYENPGFGDDINAYFEFKRYP